MVFMIFLRDGIVPSLRSAALGLLPARTAG